LKRKVLRDARHTQFEGEIEEIVATADAMDHEDEDSDSSDIIAESVPVRLRKLGEYPPVSPPSAPDENVCDSAFENIESSEASILFPASVSHSPSAHADCDSNEAEEDNEEEEDNEGYSYGSYYDDTVCESVGQVHESINENEDGSPALDVSSELVNWSFKHKITHSALNDLLVILRQHGHPELPKLASTLLKTPHCLSSDIKVLGSGEYWYHGVMNCLQVYFEPSMSTNNEIKIDFFVDGISPYDKPSKNVNLWPIAGRVICEGINTKPFIIALWCGSKKDPDCPEEFFRPFVDECAELMKGFVLNGVTYKLVIRFGIGDAPARAFMKFVNPHQSTDCCERCELRCFKESGVMTYRLACESINEEDEDSHCICNIGIPRTDQSFANRSDPIYHKGTSPLEEIMKMISQFPLEPLHLVDIGATKRLLKLLLDKKCSKVYLKPLMRSQIDALIAVLPPFMPSEFGQWKPKSLQYWSSYKGKELKRFLKYDGLLTMWLLEKMRSDQQKGVYKCFLHLSLGIRILSDSILGPVYADDAKYLLKEYVKHGVNVFGRTFNVYNNHHVGTHLADDCKMHGHLEVFDSYNYESSLGQMEKLLHAPGRPLPQIIARTLERERHGYTGGATDTSDAPRLSLPSFQGPTDGLSGESYGCFEQKFTIRVGSCNDTCLLTVSRDVVVVKNIVKNQDGIYFVGRCFQEKLPFFENPLNSSAFDIYEVRRLDPSYSHWPLSEISRKCVLLPIDLEANLNLRFETGCLAIPFTHGEKFEV